MNHMCFCSLVSQLQMVIKRGHQLRYLKHNLQAFQLYRLHTQASQKLSATEKRGILLQNVMFLHLLMH